jgi:hypothetical protein
MPNVPSLHELQHAFAACLVAGEAVDLTPWIDARGIDPRDRLRIYRNAGFAIHVEAVEAVFPAVRALVGAACFDGLATRYTARHGSTSGNLQHFGHDFPAFIRSQPETVDYPWLADVAQLEALRQDALLAAQVEPPDPDALLQTLEASDAKDIHLHLQPHVRVLCSGVPVLDLWRWAMEPQGETPDPHSPGQAVLLWRRDTRVYMQRLEADRAAFVQALCRGQGLAGALAGETAPAHLMACLRPLLDHDLIARITTMPESPAASECRS